MLDPVSGRARIRCVDVRSTRYAIARRYMIRLRRDDFDDPHELAKFAATAGMTLEQFREEFEGLVTSEPPPIRIEVLPGPDHVSEAHPASAPPAPAGGERGSG
jgi:6-phosphofructokinase 1